MIVPQRNMKILLVNCTYKEGSTGKIVYDCADYYRRQGHEVIVAYGSSSNKESGFCDTQVHQIRTMAEARLHVRLVYLGLVMQYGGMHLAYFRLTRLIEREKPDVVHLHCINGYTVNIFRTLRFLSRNGIPTVVTHHGEFYYTGNCGSAFECTSFISKQCVGCQSLRFATGTPLVDYAHRSWKRMKRAFDGFDKGKLVFTAVSPWVRERSMLSPIVNGHRCEIVKNGLNTRIFKYHPGQQLINQRVPNVTSKVVLHVTGQFAPEDKEHLKGGWYVVELAKQMPDTTFVVVATTKIISHPLPGNIFIWGSAKDQDELASLYASADVTIITSRRETFSMIVAESLCCGTPVVGFKAGGPESIAMEGYCSFVRFGRVEELAAEVKRMKEKTIDKRDLSEIACREYDRDVMSEGYLKTYHSIWSGEENDRKDYGENS